MNVHVEYGPEFKRQFKRLAKTAMQGVGDDGMN